MVAWRYGISLFLPNLILRWTLKEKFHISAGPCNILYLAYQVQSSASYVQLGVVMFSTFPSIVMTLFMGGWTDKVGRRPALIMPLLGSALDAAVVLTVMYAKLPVYCLFIGSFIHGVCGYYTTILLACLAYIADTTERGHFAFRLGKLVIVADSKHFCTKTNFWLKFFSKTLPHNHKEKKNNTLSSRQCSNNNKLLFCKHIW